MNVLRPLRPFAMVHKTVVHDTELSMAAKFYLLFAAASEDGVDVCPQAAARCAREPVEVFEAALEELKEAGYVTSDADGTWIFSDTR